MCVRWLMGWVHGLTLSRSNTATCTRATSSFCRCSCLEYRCYFRWVVAPRIGRLGGKFGLRCSTWRLERRGCMDGRRGRGSRRARSIGERRRRWLRGGLKERGKTIAAPLNITVPLRVKVERVKTSGKTRDSWYIYIATHDRTIARSDTSLCI